MPLRIIRRGQAQYKAIPAATISVRQVVHEEVDRLPQRLKAPLVLCYLQAMTQDQAAVALGLPRGTLKGRLERGRALLRARLSQRGLGPAALAVLSAWPGISPSASVAASLAQATLQAVAGDAASKVSAG